MNIGDKVWISTTGEETKIDAKVSDQRGELYRTKQDQWFDTRYLEKR